MNQTMETFQLFRKILCVCPCCQQIHRLSDLRLKYAGKTEKTWLDEYDSKIIKLEEKEAEFEEKEQGMRDKAAERGRKKVDEIINSSIDSDLSRFRYNPYDIKAIFHPVDFVVFSGLNNAEEVDDVTFLCKNQKQNDLIKIQKDVEKAINLAKYDWKIARVGTGGKIEYE